MSGKLFVSAAVVLLVVAVAATAFAGIASAKRIYVSNEYTTIQEVFSDPPSNSTTKVVMAQPVFFDVSGNAKVLWNASYANLSLDHSLISDFDGDEVDDIVLLTFNVTPQGYTYDKMIAFKGSNGQKLWEYNLGWFWPHGGIALVDLNRDGIKDIVAPNEYQQNVIAIYGNNGTLSWNYTNPSWDWGPYYIITSDLDGDGIKDVVTCGDNYSVGGVLIAAIKSNGVELWTKPFKGWPLLTASIKSSIKTENQQNVLMNTIKMYGEAYSWNYDFNGDGKGDVLLAGDVYINGQHYHGLEAVRGYDGYTLWKAGIGQGWASPYSPVDDINGDGIKEVLVSYDECSWQDGYVCTYRTLILSGSNGNELFNISQRLISPCIDWDKDGACEFFTYDGNNVYMRNANGNIAWSYALGDYTEVGIIKGSLVIFGNTFDYANETGTLKVVKVDNSGNKIWELTKDYASEESGWLYPVGDLNGDGVADYAFSSWGVGYALAINGASGNIFWELDNVSIEFIGDFDGDGKGDLFNITHECVSPEFYWKIYWKGGEGLTGDNLAYIFNVSTSDYFDYVRSYRYSTSNEYMGIDFNGDGYKDMVFVVNPEKPNSTIYMVTLAAVCVGSFDCGEPKNPYPSITGVHRGTIKPNHTVIATKLYTYACEGTGGHTEYARIWNATWEATATWEGYAGDWHNITFDKTVVLLAGETYFYEIRTGSYPQIHHTNALLTANGWINCTEFTDANGRVYHDWIPAIKLF